MFFLFRAFRLVTFADHDSAARCVAELNGREFNGRAVHLRLDRDVVDSTHNIFVGNLPWSLKNEQLQDLFQPFRPIECQVLTNMYGKSRGFAIVKFSNDSDAQRAIAAMHMTPVNGRNIEVRVFVFALVTPLGRRY
jgi:RNA recognition motif-containing protein